MNEPDKPATCPACAEKRIHNVRELREFHPYAGHGIIDGKPTVPDLPAETVKPLL